MRLSSIIPCSHEGGSVRDAHRDIVAGMFLPGGFQMVLKGVLGESIWRTLDGVRAGPRDLVEEILGAPPPSSLPFSP